MIILLKKALSKLFIRFYWLTALGISIFVLFLSSLQHPPQPEVQIPFLDKIVHFVLYFFVGICYLHSFTCSWKKMTKKRRLLAFAFAILFGGFDEFYQSFIPNRSPDFFDWLADSSGVFAGFSLCLWWWRKRS